MHVLVVLDLRALLLPVRDIDPLLDFVVEIPVDASAVPSIAKMPLLEWDADSPGLEGRNAKSLWMPNARIVNA